MVTRTSARLYASIFPNSRVDSVTSLESESPSGPPRSVKVVDFTLMGRRFQAMTAGPHDKFNDAISIVVLCRNRARAKRVTDALMTMVKHDIAALKKAWRS